MIKTFRRFRCQPVASKNHILELRGLHPNSVGKLCINMSSMASFTVLGHQVASRSTAFVEKAHVHG